MNTDPNGTITGWLHALRGGHEEAAQRLWEGYFRRLVGLARQKLGLAPRGPADAEDVALSAFDSFYRGVEAGRFPKLADRHDLWQVLVMLTARKAVDAIRREGAAKRGGKADAAANPLDEVIADDPTPSFAAEVADEYRRLLDALPDAILRDIALAKMEGYTNAEIATRIGLSVATVERKLKLIRDTWEANGDG